MPGLLEVLADKFHGGFVRFRASAEGFYILQIAGRDRAQAFDKVERHIRDAVKRRREGYLRHLLLHGLDQARVSVPQRGHKNPPDGIEIPVALSIPVVQPFRPINDQRVADEFLHRAEVNKRTLE